jgi:hypothetical protein
MSQYVPMSINNLQEGCVEDVGLELNVFLTMIVDGDSYGSSRLYKGRKDTGSHLIGLSVGDDVMPKRKISASWGTESCILTDL